jgi:hypothetical protein
VADLLLRKHRSLMVLCAITAIGWRPRPVFADASKPEPGTGGALGSVALGAALPLGNLERGSKLRDVTFASMPVEVTGGYETGRRLALLGLFRYAPSVPTMCASAGECVASIGREIVVGIRVSRAGTELHGFVPVLSLDVGYEWFASKLVDEDATSQRRYRGPFAAMDFLAVHRWGERWQVGPFAQVGAGRFTSLSLVTPSWQRDLPIDQAAMHFWAVLGVRLVRHP